MNMVKKLACGVVCAAVALGAASAEAGVWLRFSFTKVRSVAQIQMSELAVYDKFGSRVNLNLTEAASGTAAEDLVEGALLLGLARQAQQGPGVALGEVIFFISRGCSSPSLSITRSISFESLSR